MIEKLKCLILPHKFSPWSEKFSSEGLTAEVYGLPFIQVRYCERCDKHYYRPSV